MFHYKTKKQKMNPEQFFYKVKEMRDAQKEYFKYRTKSALDKSKKLESEIDNEVKRVIAIKNEQQQMKLFNQ